MRMYTLIMAEKASMWELKNCYTLDEALKLYALYDMGQDENIFDEHIDYCDRDIQNILLEV